MHQKKGKGGREEEGSSDKENKTVLWFEPVGLHASSPKGAILSEQPNMASFYIMQF